MTAVSHTFITSKGLSNSIPCTYGQFITPPTSC